MLVTVAVARVVSWPDLQCSGEPSVSGSPAGVQIPLPRRREKGTGPRVDVERAAKRARSLPHVLLGWAGADGYPMVVAVRVGAAGPRASSRGPAAGRRAPCGAAGPRYEAKLIGLETRQYTGWLRTAPTRPTQRRLSRAGQQDAAAAANGFMAKRGLKKARAAQAAPA